MLLPEDSVIAPPVTGADSGAGDGAGAASGAGDELPSPPPDEEDDGSDEKDALLPEPDEEPSCP